jgi:hypothetical protein
MPQASLKLEVSNLTGDPAGPLRIAFTPLGAGGAALHAETEAASFSIGGIQCLGGPGTLYQVRIDAPNYRPYGFFQRMVADAKNSPSDGRVLLVTDVRRVKGITAPPFHRLSANARRVARDAAAYDSLHPMLKACLLNVCAKAAHASSGRCLKLIGPALSLQRDRCFCQVDPALPAFLQRSALFRTVNGSLHQPLEGYLRQESYKTLDPHANLQITLMHNPQTNQWAADIDIDEAAGFSHGFEVIRNRLTGGRTNPYQVRELLLLADWQERTLDPGYTFVL